MYNGMNVSLKTVLWKVMNNPYASDISYEQAAEFATEAIRLVGAPFALIDKITQPALKVSNHKVAMPENLIILKGVKSPSDRDSVGGVPMTYATDTFHTNTECLDDSDGCEGQGPLTYTHQNGVMFTSFPEGYVTISYKALPVDDEGYPLIADDQDTLLAIEYYILFRYLEPLWMIGKVTDKVFEYINQKKCWYLPAASNSLKLQGPDQLEAVMNTVNRLIVNNDAHMTSFKYMGIKERIKKY